MHAFDYVMTLMSFVYALAIAHLLATIGDIIGAWSRVRFSFINAAWMMFSLLGVIAWWVGLWDPDRTGAWQMGQLAVFFVLACILYLQMRLVCARIPLEGPVDLAAFHAQEGRKYLTGYAVLTAFTLAVNLIYFPHAAGLEFEKNYAVAGMFAGAIVSTVFLQRRAVQIALVVAESGLWLWYFGTLQRALA